MFSQPIVHLLAFAILAGCSSSTTEPTAPPVNEHPYDNWTCTCTDENDVPLAVYPYCGTRTADAGDVPSVEAGN